MAAAAARVARDVPAAWSRWVLPSPYGAGGRVEGFVAPGWDRVRAAFEANFAAGQELGAQLTIRRRGRVVVDLSGASASARAPAGYGASTMQCVYSTGKNLEAVAVAMLVDRGLLDYGEKVARYWPEFGAAGKSGVTVADLMRHEGGVPILAQAGHEHDRARDRKLTPDDVRAVEPMEAMIAAAARMPPPPPPAAGGAGAEGAYNPRCYHMLTRGFAVSALLRRVDPAGRSLGRFVADEIASPLGRACDGGSELRCGIPTAEQRDCNLAPLRQPSLLYAGGCILLPALLGLGCPVLSATIRTFRSSTSILTSVPVTWFDPKLPRPSFNNTPEGRALEIPSAGVYASARGLAALHATMASGGLVPDDRADDAGGGGGGGRAAEPRARLLSAEAVAEALAEPVDRPDTGLEGNAWAMTRGGFARLDTLRGLAFHPDDPGAYAGLVGWGGWGGSIGAWDPDRDLALAYVPSGMGPYLIGGPRSRAILHEVQRALAETGG